MQFAVNCCREAIDLSDFRAQVTRKLLIFKANLPLKERVVNWLRNFMGRFLENLIIAIIIHFLLG